MKNEHSPDKYSEILDELKNEKMNWDFEEFLQKAEDSSFQTLEKDHVKSRKLAPYYWIAASSVILIGLFFILKFSGNSSVEGSDEMVKNEILDQKNSGALKDTLEINSSTIAVLDSAENNDVSSDFVSFHPSDRSVTDRILSKKERLRKKIPVRYVENSNNQDISNSNFSQDSGFSRQENYVMVNGKYVQNEDEAMEITRRALKTVGKGMSEAIDETKVIAKMNIEF